MRCAAARTSGLPAVGVSALAGIGAAARVNSVPAMVNSPVANRRYLDRRVVLRAIADASRVGCGPVIGGSDDGGAGSSECLGLSGSGQLGVGADAVADEPPADVGGILFGRASYFGSDPARLPRTTTSV